MSSFYWWSPPYQHLPMLIPMITINSKDSTGKTFYLAYKFIISVIAKKHWFNITLAMYQKGKSRVDMIGFQVWASSTTSQTCLDRAKYVPCWLWMCVCRDERASESCSWGRFQGKPLSWPIVLEICRIKQIAVFYCSHYC